MLAAQALRMGAVVATHNTAEFSRVPRLDREDWQGE
jgi:predicted nucleic acid-binding protein